jgi:hypothetical protein
MIVTMVFRFTDVVVILKLADVDPAIITTLIGTGAFDGLLLIIVATTPPAGAGPVVRVRHLPLLRRAQVPDGGIRRLDLERAIARLPEGARAAFVLHDVEGFQHQEIASILGISEGTSKSQVHKARLKLRALLTAAAL